MNPSWAKEDRDRSPNMAIVWFFAFICFGLAGAFWYAHNAGERMKQEESDEIRFMQTCLREQKEYVCSAMWHRK